MRKQPKSPAEHHEKTDIKSGDQLISFKTQPNHPCTCGSGLKQKKCCGNKSDRRVTARHIEIFKKPDFIYISTKYTHRKDKYFFMWRHESKGYHFAREEAGIFHVAYSSREHVCSVPKETAAPLFIEAVVDNHKCHVLPNTPANRKIMGIDLKDLTATFPYNF